MSIHTVEAAPTDTAPAASSAPVRNPDDGPLWRHYEEIVNQFIKPELTAILRDLPEDERPTNAKDFYAAYRTIFNDENVPFTTFRRWLNICNFTSRRVIAVP